MIHLIDTNVVIDAMAARPLALAALSAVQASEPRISIISLGELYEGALRDFDPSHRLRAIDAFLIPFTVIELDKATMVRFGIIRARLRAAGQLIGDLDILIAATALEQGLRLVTRNRKHFERIPGLRFVTPHDLAKE